MARMILATGAAALKVGGIPRLFHGKLSIKRVIHRQESGAGCWDVGLKMRQMLSRRRQILRGAPLGMTLAALPLLGSQLHANDVSWISNRTGSWSNNSNWVGGAPTAGSNVTVT